MFNIATIQNELKTLVGFSQMFRKDVDRLDSDLTTSLSASYIDQSAHPLITGENLIVMMETFRKSDVVDWSSSIAYKVGDIVVRANKLYYSIQNGTNQDPSTQTAYWTETNLISAYLRRLREKAVTNLFESVFANRKLYELGKTLLTDVSLYEGTGSLRTLITKFSRFVGYEVTPKYKDSKVIITHIGLQLSAPAELPVYLFCSSSLAPIAIANIDHTNTTTFQWHELETPFEMYRNSDTTNDASRYFIGYFESDLPEGCQAVWKEMTWNECSSCNGINASLYRRWSNFFKFNPIYVQNNFLDGTNMWELDKTLYLANQNWGMNFRSQVHCDVTSLIVRNKFAFSKALKVQIVHDILNEMAYSLRDNQKAGSLSQKAFYALETKENGDKGVQKMLENEIKNVNFDLSDFSSVCLPKSKGSTGVKTKSVFK